MMYFLKYRPQTIEDLDSEIVRDKLKKILKQEKIPHAFLFSGPKGIGKTSSARILAKAINCLNKKKGSIEPCNQCNVCKEITSGVSLDVCEIDAASNRGIDDIRQLKEKISLAPISSKYKVYIIDEVHMLTKEAFNALLKTLEEPPNHVVFVLCTTNPEKIIPTVLSRLLRIDFPKGSPKEIKRSLDKVIKGEKLSIDEKVVTAIARLTDGSFRDAQKILESLTLSLGKKVSWNKAKDLLGHWEKGKPEKILSLLSEGDLKEALKVSEYLANEGADFSDYLHRLLDLIQKMILVKAGAEKGSKEQIKLVAAFKLRDLVRLSRLLSQALIEQKSAVLSQLPFQLAMIDFLSPESNLPNRGQVSPNRRQASLIAAKEKRDQSSDPKESPPLRQTNNDKKDGRKKTGVEKLEIKGSQGKVGLRILEDQWENLLKVIRPMNHSVAAFLRSARPKEINGDILILEVFYQFHKDKLEEDRNRKIVEQGLGQVYNLPFKIKCVLGQRSRIDNAENEVKKAVIDKDKNEVETDAQGGGDLYQIAKEIFGS